MLRPSRTRVSAPGTPPGSNIPLGSREAPQGDVPAFGRTSRLLPASVVLVAVGAVAVPQQAPVAVLRARPGQDVGVAAGGGVGVHPVGEVELHDHGLGGVHHVLCPEPVGGRVPHGAALGHVPDLLLERVPALEGAAGIVPGGPSLVQVVEELEGQGVPGEPGLHVLEELPDGVVVGLVLPEHGLAGRRIGELVVVHVQNTVEHVPQHLGALQIIAFDVLPLTAGKALGEGDDQLPPVERVRLVLEPGHLVDALHHEAEESVADGGQALAVDADGVPRHGGLQVGRLVDEGADVVLVDDDGRRPGDGLQHEVLAEITDGDGGHGGLAAQPPQEGAQGALAVVAFFGVEPSGLVPTDEGADDGAHDLPDELHDLPVVGQALDPALHVPVRAIDTIVYCNIDGVRVVVDVRLGQKYIVRGEGQ